MCQFIYMHYFKRNLDLNKILTKKSLFLFGPRQTGKTSYIKNQLNRPVLMNINLLLSDAFLEYTQSPILLRERALSLNEKKGIIVVDEVQRVPSLLNEIHWLIEEKGFIFLLTGSSMRKLLRKVGEKANLLGGRARIQYLWGLSYMEFNTDDFDLLKALNRGLLPSIYFSDDPQADLRTYGGTYLEAEIAAEAQIRKLDAFSRFLKTAAQASGQIINFSKLGVDSQVPRKTVVDYFDVLKDTLIATEVPAWGFGRSRKSMETSRFYFFDPGIRRSLAGIPPIQENSADFGFGFEHYIFHEIKSYIDYNRQDLKLYHWRSQGDHEVDFILGEDTAIEVKASHRIIADDLKGLKAISEEMDFKHLLIVCRESAQRSISIGKNKQIEVLPWITFIKRLWDGEYSSSSKLI